MLAIMSLESAENYLLAYHVPGLFAYENVMAECLHDLKRAGNAPGPLLLAPWVAFKAHGSPIRCGGKISHRPHAIKRDSDLLGFTATRRFSGCPGFALDSRLALPQEAPMSISIRFTEDGKGIIQEAWEVLTLKEMVGALRKVQRNEQAFKSAVYVLSDLSKVTAIPVSVKQIRHIADEDRRMAPLNPSLISATVAPEDAIFGMVRLWQVLVTRDGWSAEIFRTRAGAEEWLRERVPGFEPDSVMRGREP
jgi:hypothetical protein